MGKEKGETKAVILFVHGFGSSGKCWDKLRTLLAEDNRINSRYELRCFEYPTAWFGINPFHRIPRIQEIARSLRELIDSPDFYERELTLVGHSQGGLVIQSYLSQILSAGEGERLDSVRQVILFATPNLGSTFISPLRKLMSILVFNPQERLLRVLEPEIAEIRTVITERVVNAKASTSTAWPIPIHIFYGLRDRVVAEASARGTFGEKNITPLDADHFTILNPKDSQDMRYLEFVEALIEPSGHVNVFEVTRYETKIKVEPSLKKQEHEWKHGDTIRTVHSNNICYIDRSVRFSRKNRCVNPPFTIRYSTRHGGFLKYKTSHVNEANPEEKGKYDDYGNEVIFRFTPRPGETYDLKVEVYGGFGKDQRDVHFHLGRDSYFKERGYTLDLSGYVALGYSISQVPKLYFHPNDPGHGELCNQRGIGRDVEPTEIDQGGIWRWELARVRQGVVDIVWDISEQPAQSH